MHSNQAVINRDFDTFMNMQDKMQLGIARDASDDVMNFGLTDDLKYYEQQIFKNVDKELYVQSND